MYRYTVRLVHPTLRSYPAVPRRSFWNQHNRQSGLFFDIPELGVKYNPHPHNVLIKGKLENELQTKLDLDTSTMSAIKDFERDLLGFLKAGGKDAIVQFAKAYRTGVAKEEFWKMFRK